MDDEPLCAYCNGPFPKKKYGAPPGTFLCCSISCGRLMQTRGARMICGYCGDAYQALQGRACFCSDRCVEHSEQSEMEKATRLFAEWQPRAQRAA